jgi:hypothetical protein
MRGNIGMIARDKGDSGNTANIGGIVAIKGTTKNEYKIRHPAHQVTRHKNQAGSLDTKHCACGF